MNWNADEAVEVPNAQVALEDALAGDQEPSDGISLGPEDDEEQEEEEEEEYEQDEDEEEDDDEEEASAGDDANAEPLPDLEE